MIQIEDTFEMAHRTPTYGYGEDSIHGHTWRVIIDASVLDDDALLEEAGSLKEVLTKNVVDALDRVLMVWENDDLIDTYRQLEKTGLVIFKADFNPTARNIAAFLFRELKTEFYERGYALQRIKLHEGNVAAVTTTTGVIAE